MNDENPQCSKQVWIGYHNHQCYRSGAVKRDDKWYCKQHDPKPPVLEVMYWAEIDYDDNVTVFERNITKRTNKYVWAGPYTRWDIKTGPLRKTKVEALKYLLTQTSVAIGQAEAAAKAKEQKRQAVVAAIAEAKTTGATT